MVRWIGLDVQIYKSEAIVAFPARSRRWNSNKVGCEHFLEQKDLFHEPLSQKDLSFSVGEKEITSHAPYVFLFYKVISILKKLHYFTCCMRFPMGFKVRSHELHNKVHLIRIFVALIISFLMPTHNKWLEQL